MFTSIKYILKSNNAYFIGPKIYILYNSIGSKFVLDLIVWTKTVETFFKIYFVYGCLLQVWNNMMVSKWCHFLFLDELCL